MMTLLVTVVCLCLTAVLWWQVERDVIASQRADFDYRVRDTLDRIEQRMNVYAELLRGAQGMFAGSQEVSRKEFQTYIEALQIEKNYPGILGIGFVKVIPKKDLAEHTAEIRGQGLSDYSVWPAGDRDIYTSVVHLEPSHGYNLRVLGYDMFTDTVRRAAMEKARDSEMASITSKLRLVNDAGSGDQAAFLMYLPVYKNGAPHGTLAERRENILGWVHAPLRMNDLMANLNGERSGDIDIVIFDGETMSPETLMYDTDDDAFTLDPDIPLLKALHRITIAGHTWTIALHSMPSFEARGHSLNPRFIASAGIALSLLLGALTYLLAAGRVRALAIAMGMMKELRKSEEVWKFALEGSRDGVWDWNVQTGETIFSPRWKEILGYRESELRNHIDEWISRIHPEDVEKALADIQAHFDGGEEAFESEHRVLCKDGSWKWLLARGTLKSRTHDGQPLRMVGTYSDVTERRKSGERERRLKDMYRTLSACNEAIIHESDELALLSRVCRIAVDFGGMTHAVICLPDSEGRFDPIAQFGRFADQKREITVMAVADVPEGCGPSGIAYRENHPVVVNDALGDPLLSPWRQWIPKYGTRSLATFPIQRSGKPYAIFSVYSDQFDAFDEEIVSLLDEMAANISFALGNFDSETARHQAQLALAQSEERFRLALANSQVTVFEQDRELRYTSFHNPRLSELADRVIGKRDADFIDPESAVKVESVKQSVIDAGVPVRTEISGSAFGRAVEHYDLYAEPRYDDDGNITGIICTAVDITERKKSDERERHLKNMYSTLSATNEAILRLESPSELFPLVCRTAVEHGGVMHAWIGVPDTDGRFRPVASFGTVSGFVENMIVLSQRNASEGFVPASIAFNEGHSLIINDVRSSNISSRWSDRAEVYGIQAVSAYPICRGEKPHAIFVLYSDQAGAFDKEIAHLLERMAANISFALDNFDREAMRREKEEEVRAIFDNASDGIFIVSPTGRYLDVNERGAQMLGYLKEEILDRKMGDIIAEPERAQVFEEIAKLGGSESAISEWQFVRKNGTVFLGEVGAQMLPDGRGIGIVRDITERRRAEERLRVAALVYQNAGEAMVVTDADCTIVSINPAFTKLTGYAPEEVIRKTPRILKSGRHSPAFYEAMWHSITTEGRWQGEIWNRRKDGIVYPERLSINTVFREDGAVHCYVAMFQDLTREKESEEMIRALSANHIAVKEEEGKRIAREIHDDLGQRLTLLRMDVLMLPKALGENGEGLPDAVARMKSSLDDCISIARNIVSDLRPAVLDLGIVPAIEWLVDEFETRTGIECLFCNMMDGGPNLTDQQAIGVFRILQESLNNVAKHAKATQVEVELACSNEQLYMEIVDNGVGIEASKMQRANSYGLIGLRERAAILGGRISVSGPRGRGTTLRLWVPLASTSIQQ